MATINGVEVIGDKTAHDFGLLDNQDKTEIDNGIERNREATEDNHEDIVRHRTDTDVHVTPAWKNSLVTKEILGLYWTAAQTADIINEISIAGGAKLVKVDVLPETGLEQTIYLVPKTDPQAGDVFDEYVWIDNKFEFIGTTKVDLSNYATKTELDAKANDADVVHNSGDETISGSKRFSGSTLYFNYANVDNVRIFADGEGGNIRLTDSDNNYHYEFDTVAKNYLRLYGGNSSNELTGGFCFYSNGDFLPAQGSSQNLGSSDFKWKTINGINPGALSLPEYTNTFSIKGYFNPTSTTDKGSWTATCDCVVFISGADIEGYFSINNAYPHYWFRRGMNSLWGYTSIWFFVRKGDVVGLKVFGSSQGYNTGSIDVIDVYPCQGNV